MSGSKLRLHKQSEKESSYREIDMLGHIKPKHGPVSTQQYNLVSIVPKTLWEEFQNFSYFWFLGIIILEFSSDYNKTSLKLRTLLPLVVLLLISIIKNFLIGLNQYLHDRKINSRLYQVFNGIDFEIKQSGRICIGDIILLKQDEIAPADCVILAIDSENNELYVKLQDQPQASDLTLKKAVKETQSYVVNDEMSIGEVKLHIENLKVNHPNESFGKFSGKIRIKGNPKVIGLSEQNFLIASQKILYCKWVLAVVIYSANESKIWLSFRNQRSNSITKFEKRIIIFNLMFASVLILLTIFIGYYHYELDFQDSTLAFVINSIILYNNLIPVSFFLCIRIIEIWEMLWVNFKSSNIKIMNPSVMQDLGSIEYIVAERAGILASEDITVQALAIKDLVYIAQNLKEPGESTPFKENDCQIDSKDALHLLSNGTASSLEALADELNHKEITNDQLYFIIGLLLCNTNVKGYNNEYVDADDVVVVRLLSELGVGYIERSDKNCEFTLAGTRYSFSIICYQKQTSKDQQTRVIIKNNQTEEIFFVIKGCVKSMDELIRNNTIVSEIISSNIFVGLRKIIYAYKIFTKKELNDFKFDYKQIKSSYLNTEGRLESLFDKNSHNTIYLGAIGIENIVTHATQEAVTTLTASGCKIWIATSDSQESSVLTAKTAGLITEQMSLICLNNLESHSETLSRMKKIIKNEFFQQDLGDQRLSMSNHAKSENYIENVNSDSYARSENELITLRVNSNKKVSNRRASRRRSTVKTIIKSLNYNKHQSRLKPARKHKGDINFYSILIDSKTLNYALQSQESRKNLAILLFAAKSVIFHSVSPDQKIKILRFIQSNFEFKPKVLSMSAAASLPDISFQANTSVLVTNDLSINSYSSINITSFSEIANVILNLGYHHQSRVKKIFMLTLYKEFSLSILLFLYQIQSKFSAGPILDYDLLVLLELFIALTLLTLIGVSDGNISEKDLTKTPLRYASGCLATQYELKIGAVYIAQGIIQGVLLFVFIRFGEGYISNSRGFTEDIETTGLLSLILLSCTLVIKVLTESNYNFRTLVSVVIGIICLIIVIAITCENYLGYFYITNDSFVERSSLWLLIWLFPFITFILNSNFMNEMQLMLAAKVKLRYDQYKNNISKVFIDSIYWKIRMDDSSFKINKKLAKFESNDKEALFRNSLLNENLLTFKVYVSLIFIISLIGFILNLLGKDEILIYGLYSLIPLIISFFFIIATFSLGVNYIPKINILIFFCKIALSLVKSGIDPEESTILRYPVFSLIYIVAINFSFEFALYQSIAICIASEISCILIVKETNTNEGVYVHSFHWAIAMLGITFLLLSVNYSRSILKRKEFSYIQKVEIEVERAAKILSYLLPDFIRKRVKEGARYIAEDKGTVTVIFCDLCDFETIVDTYTPQELTGFLDDLFGRIDMLCESLGVSKIETVGKTYLACAGLKDSEDKLDQNFTAIPHARRAVEMAIAVLKEIEKVKLKNGSTPKFKIGINSGPVTAGVVGFHKPQFSLVGDTVNTASRMSSTLNEMNAIQISMSTYENLGNLDGLIFTDCSVDVKGKGTMETKKVSLPLKINEENAIEEFSSIVSQRHSFIQAPNSPVVRTSTSKAANENIIVAGPNNRRSSLLVNLEIRNDSDILNKMQTHKVDRIINFICKETEVERKFRLKFLKHGKFRQVVGLTTSLIVNLLLLVIEIVQFSLKIEHYSLFRLIIIAIEELLTLIFLFISRDNYRKLSYGYALAALYTIDFIAFFVSHLFSRDNILIVYMYFYLRFIQLNFFTGLLFSRIMYFNIISIVFWLVELSLWTPDTSSILFTIIYTLITIATVYSFERKQRINASLKQAAKKELEQTKQLLTQMMPPNALQNLEKELVVTDRFNQVTLMYADIVGFTAWSSVRSPKEVVGMLSELFTRFDKMCLVYNVYKVHTIGDCYVAMGYINDNNRNPAKEAINMLKFAQSLIGVIEETNDKVKCQLGMRIGMHTGQVIGGITGTKIVRYDIYGPDVLIANKMESNGEASKITVSESTRDLIDSYMPGEYRFIEFKEIRIPALSKSVKIYFIGENDGLE